LSPKQTKQNPPATLTSPFSQLPV
jgi:hypothetical protein